MLGFIMAAVGSRAMAARRLSAELQRRLAVAAVAVPSEHCQAPARELGEYDLGALAGELLIVTAQDRLDTLGIPAALRGATELAGEVPDTLNISGTPFAIAVDPDGIVRARGVPSTVQQLRNIAAVLA